MKNELFKIMAEEAIMGFITFDLTDRNCVYINKRARELFEVLDQEISLTLDQVFATEARGDFKAFSADLIAHEGLYQDVLVRKNNGQFFIANVGVRRLSVDDTKLVVLMVQDVSLQKKLQREVIAKQLELKTAFEELLKQNQQLKELDIAKNRFIALTTHELRTPMAAMVASAEILHMKIYDTPEQMNEFIEIIYEQGQHLHTLINDILDFAKIQAGRMDFYIENQEPQTLIQSLSEAFTSMADAQSIKIEVVAPESPLTCYFDDLRLRQVLSNIVNNAIKYNRPNGIVKVWCEETHDVLKVLVQDSGNGIPAEQIEKVFNEFETLGQVATHHKGTGLGMPISRRLMEGMGGKLLVSSEVGVGSIFWVEIPKHKVLAEDVYRPRPGGAHGDLAA